MVVDDLALRCRGLEKSFGATRALAEFDIDLKRGEVLALLGPSGCGKTTALRIIAGFEQPDAGSVEVGGRLVTGPGERVPPEKRRIGMVFQDFALFPHMTVAANVGYGVARGADRGKKVEELLSLVGLQGLDSRMPHQLSGGQQQRVALARALAAEPELILLDEPFSNLDPSIRERVRGEVRQLIRSIGITAVFVTHDQEEALSLAEQVAVMIAGRVLQVGSPVEIYTRPASREVGEFIGNANFVPAELRDGIAQSELGPIRVASDLTGRVELMLRAESLALAEDGAPAEVVSSEYYGHDQMVTLRLVGGQILRMRLLTTAQLSPGQKVGVVARGEVLAFPVRA